MAPKLLPTFVYFFASQIAAAPAATKNRKSYDKRAWLNQGRDFSVYFLMAGNARFMSFLPRAVLQQ